MEAGNYDVGFVHGGGRPTHLIILISSLMLTWSGTRNLVLSRMGSCFSPLYLSMITCRTRKRRKVKSGSLWTSRGPADGCRNHRSIVRTSRWNRNGRNDAVKKHLVLMFHQLQKTWTETDPMIQQLVEPT